MEPVTLTLLIGVISLLITNTFQLIRKIHKSNCFKCCSVEMEDSKSLISKE